VAYIEHRYPLIDRRMTRADCHAWLARQGLTAPRSACIGCPFRSDAEWLAIRADPVLWADACAVDASLRNGEPRAGAGSASGVHGDAYLHRSCTPLADAPLRNRDQLDLFGCDGGHCGV